MRRTTAIVALVAIAGMTACSGGDRPGTDDGSAAATESAAQPGTASGTGTMVARAGTTIAPTDTIEVWKDPGCGCCKNWIEHMQEHGFAVIAHDTRDMTPVKQQHDVGADLTSCHTASIRGYAIEGHVPADLVRKMLDEKPAIRGLAVPGMPMGSPGMEGAVKQKYDVIAFTADGKRTVYASR